MPMPFGPKLCAAAAGALAAVAVPAGAEDRLLQESVEFAGVIAFLSSGAPGMVIAATRDGETAFAGFGETARGNGKEPTADTLMRIGSISKAFCGDLAGALYTDGTIALTDPLAEHLGEGWTVPQAGGRTLRLIDLVTQSSGLPREVPNQTGGTPEDPFAGNTYALSQAELAKAPYLFPPGTGALYSNWGFDLLGAALAAAGGKPYAELLAERVLEPRGMSDTRFNLAPGDEARTMQGHFFDGSPMPLAPTPETIECAGGLYTTAADMLKWMEWHLDREDAAYDAWRTADHAGWLWRDGLSPVSGLDDGGDMAAMTLGWVAVAPDGSHPMMLNKSGGLQGQFSYVVIAPSRGVGVFASINQFSVGGFAGMVKAANDLIADLAPR